MNLRHWARWAFAAALRATGELRRARKGLEKSGAVVVMTFHRVLEDEDLERTSSLPGIVIGRTAFERLAEYVTRRYRAVAAHSGWNRDTAPRLRFCFTFDDGWSDNFGVALPVAQKHGIPLCVFVCTELAGMDKPFWPERLSAAMRLANFGRREIEDAIERNKTAPAAVQEQAIAGYGGDSAAGGDGLDSTMTWEQVEQMERAGVRIGSHTATHQLLTEVGPGRAIKELADSRKSLERRFGKACAVIAYPNGNHNAEVLRWASEAGYEMGFTTECGAWTAGVNPLAIPRVNVCEDNVIDPTGRFSAAMFDYAVTWKAWRRLRAGRKGQA